MISIPHTGDKNCITYWMPRLEAAGIPMPRTKIVRWDTEDQKRWIFVVRPPGSSRFFEELQQAAESFGSPCFLRSSHFSGKHDWKRCCFVCDPQKLMDHVFSIIEMGECVNFLGFPWDAWAVREYLPPMDGDVAFVAKRFGDMPVRREYRCFVRDGVVECVHPYWPGGAFDGLNPGEDPFTVDPHPTKESEMANLIADPGEHLDAIVKLAATAGAALPGYWSVDILRDSTGKWMVTDCAVGADSFHWDPCDVNAAAKETT